MQFDQASNSKPLRFWGAELMYANDVPIPGVLYELPLNFENVQPNMHVLITPSLCFCFALPPLFLCPSEIRLPASALTLDPFYWRNDYLGVEQWSRSLVRGQYVALPALHEQHELFAADWSNVLRLQGFVGAFTDAAILG